MPDTLQERNKALISQGNLYAVQSTGLRNRAERYF